MTDGIGDLLSQRQANIRKTATRPERPTVSPSRTIPGPRNPAKAKISDANKADAGTVEAPRVPAQAASPQPAEAGPTVQLSDDRRVTLYIAAEADEWLEQTRIAGRRARVDASRSAIVRVALERLMAQTTHEEIVAELAARVSTAGPTRGRRRL